MLPRWGEATVARLAAWLALACALTACAGRDEQDERERRARQMRDVARMLDAMEASQSSDASAQAPHVASAYPNARSSAASLPDARSQRRSTRSSYASWGAVAAGVLSALALFTTVLWRRHRKKPSTSAEPPSIVACFAPREAPPPIERNASPTWVYRTSPFEAPPWQIVNDPVDLSLPPARKNTTAAAVPDETHAAPSPSSFDHLRALPRRDAEPLFDDMERETRGALGMQNGDERARSLAQLIRIRLARIEQLSGATRLFAVRDLATEHDNDPNRDAPPVIDSLIDVQLAWASWVRGTVASARLDEADRLCDQLMIGNDNAIARGLHRRGEVWLRRATLRKSSESLSELQEAQRCLDEAHTRRPEPETALLVAQTAQRRAGLLPPHEAAEACSHALVHAFLAEQHAECRVEALACRLQTQMTYEALPQHAANHDISASLGRSLAAAGLLSPGARLAVARARLLTRDAEGAAAACEALWRDGEADRLALDLWREACACWATLDAHDAQALSASLRHLAIARSTL
ncbi:hypothetical protein IM816_06815 [Luteibacter flocculans]|uniref:Uncharacterized protein n=1 Tax=Luteibacter flocculans TaxID=2780091 RepID=A0ABY4T4G5_9GAMM|nr:hypothetical protein [Luteibacter flocculans]URL59798.1 hypothetical protein IM816_06815 [Luteibacter flocculans]